MAANAWDSRYDREDYVFGTEPAVFLTDHAGMIPPGARVLTVAEGEGRNAVWLAARGCHVTGFDGSPVALDKARRLAAARGVTVDLHEGDITTWDWAAERYDLVVAVFIQFLPPAARGPVFAGLKRALAPGGRLMLTGYTPEQVGYGTGGPPNPDFMYTEALLLDAFGDLQVRRLARYEKILKEGPGHDGRSALIDLIADAPA